MFKTLIKNTDLIILILVVALVIIGIVGIYSAGYNDISSKEDYFKQFVWLGISLAVLTIFWFIDYNIMSFVSIPLYVICIGLLIRSAIYNSNIWCYKLVSNRVSKCSTI